MNLKLYVLIFHHIYGNFMVKVALIHDAFVNATQHVCFAYIFCPEMYVRN